VDDVSTVEVSNGLEDLKQNDRCFGFMELLIATEHQGVQIASSKQFLKDVSDLLDIVLLILGDGRHTCCFGSRRSFRSP